MKDVRIRFTEEIRRTASVVSFRFVPNETLDFRAGQFLQIIFDEDNRVNKTLNKYLSFSCAPGKGYIEVTKRISESEFSQRLLGLTAGDEVLIKGPMGHCVLAENDTKVGFLIGGIGITPVISIIEDIVGRPLPVNVCLLYSNRSEDDIAFRSELDAWSGKNPDIKVVYAVSRCETKDTQCILGTINKEMVQNHACDYRDRTVFIFGPPGMVQAMAELCRSIGCQKERVKTETFIGY